MKFKASELRDLIQLQILGDEAWLGEIYRSFGVRADDVASRLTGAIRLAPKEHGYFLLSGSFSFRPHVPCGRCEDSIAWPISREFEVRFLFRGLESGVTEDDTAAEWDLEPQDLDSYYIDHDTIDLELVINDFVQTAFPTRLIKVTADGKNCAICLADVTGPLVYREGDAASQSPFAALKDLKLPKN